MNGLKLSILFFLLVSFDLLAQDNQESIAQGFRTGNVDKISSEMAEEIELFTPENEGTFSKDMSAKKLKAFFSSCKPLNFKIIHQGTSPSGSAYCIGQLETEKGNYRIYMLFSGKGGNKLSELRIEKDE